MTRAGGSTRKPAGSRGSNFTVAMMALFPGEQVKTAAAKPTFLIYLPEHTAPKAEFLLAKDAQYTDCIYCQELSLPGQSGLLKIELPNNNSISDLTPDQPYYWCFTLRYPIQGRGEPESISECIQRVTLSPEVKLQLSQLSPQERLDLYLSLGLPYDACTELDQLRRDLPLENWVEATWASWMINAGWHHLIDVPTLHPE